METDLQAYISALHYDVPIENPDESYDNIDRKIGQFDFKIDRDNTDHNILTSYNQTNNLLSLNHRGTSKNEDIISDLAYGVGLEKYNSQFDERRFKTKNILKEYSPKNPDIFLHGHSLGGATLSYAIGKSPSIIHNVKEVNTFNTASHPFFNNLVIDKDIHKNELNEKVKHHRAGGDIVSKFIKNNNPFGKIVKYKIGKKNQGLFNSHKLQHFTKYLN